MPFHEEATSEPRHQAAVALLRSTVEFLGDPNKDFKSAKNRSGKYNRRVGDSAIPDG